MPDILHIRGRHDGIDFDHMYGPDRDRRYLKIKTVTYDANTDITELRLRAILPADFREQIEPLIANQRERERIRKVFNG